MTQRELQNMLIELEWRRAEVKKAMRDAERAKHFAIGFVMIACFITMLGWMR